MGNIIIPFYNQLHATEREYKKRLLFPFFICLSALSIPSYGTESHQNKSAPIFGTTHSEVLWDEQVRAFGKTKGLRFGSALTVISNDLKRNSTHGTGYDWDIYIDYKMVHRETWGLTVGGQFEDRGTWSGSDPNFNGFPQTSIFVLDGNYYDHDPDVVELWAQWDISSIEFLIGRFDQGRRFAGFSYGGSFRYFFNQAFSGNSTLSLPFAQAFGTDVTWHINDSWYAVVGVADANAVSNKMINYNGDLYSYAEITYMPKGGFYHLYYWHSDEGERDKVKNGQPEATPESYGAGLSMEQKLSVNLLWFSRLGFSNEDGTAPSQLQVSSGFVYDVSQPYAIGFGLSWNKATDVPLFNKIPVENEEQITAEVFLRLNLTEKVNASIGYTYIDQPFYSTDSDEQVYSARFQVWY